MVFAIKQCKGARCIITGDTTYHYISDVKEEGIAVIDAGHFATEWPPMMHFGKKNSKNYLENNFDNKSIYIQEKCKTRIRFVLSFNYRKKLQFTKEFGWITYILRVSFRDNRR